MCQFLRFRYSATGDSVGYPLGTFFRVVPLTVKLLANAGSQIISRNSSGFANMCFRIRSVACFEHICKQSATQEGAIVGANGEGIAGGDGQFSLCGNVASESGVVGRLVVAKSGIARQLECEVPWFVAEDAVVKLANLEHYCSYEFFELT